MPDVATVELCGALKVTRICGSPRYEVICCDCNCITLVKEPYISLNFVLGELNCASYIVLFMHLQST